MTWSHQATSQEQKFPIASISNESRLVFPSPKDLDRAWDLGIFYLKVPDSLDLDGARQFGGELIAPDSPYRQIPKYCVLE